MIRTFGALRLSHVDPRLVFESSSDIDAERAGLNPGNGQPGCTVRNASFRKIAQL